MIRRLVQNWRRLHVWDRCSPEGCDCPCPGCRHDPAHAPGEPPSLLFAYRWWHRRELRLGMKG